MTTRHGGTRPPVRPAAPLAAASAAEAEPTLVTARVARRSLTRATRFRRAGPLRGRRKKRPCGRETVPPGERTSAREQEEGGEGEGRKGGSRRRFFFSFWRVSRFSLVVGAASALLIFISVDFFLGRVVIDRIIYHIYARASVRLCVVCCHPRFFFKNLCFEFFQTKPAWVAVDKWGVSAPFVRALTHTYSRDGRMVSLVLLEISFFNIVDCSPPPRNKGRAFQDRLVPIAHRVRKGGSRRHNSSSSSGGSGSRRQSVASIPAALLRGMGESSCCFSLVVVCCC